MGPPPGGHDSTSTAAPALSSTPNDPIEVAPDDSYEDDPSYDSELGSYTTSLASAVTDYKFENGRRYHSFREGSYIWPNDETESERLDMMHKLFECAMGKSHFSPIVNPRRILDIGTGTGIWAMEIADKFPSAEVLGNDLSPIQPKWVPPNLTFEVDDVEADWTYSMPFDFIHCRQMLSAIKDWPRFMRQAFKHLAPGGYAEFIDFDALWTSPDGSLKEDSTIYFVNRKFSDLSIKAGTEPSPGPKLEGWAKDIGFQEIKVTKLPIPCGTWPADKKLKEVGAWHYLELMEGLDGMLLAIFTRYFNMSKNEVHALAAKFKAEMKDPKMHAMLYLYVVVGRKPLESSDSPD